MRSSSCTASKLTSKDHPTRLIAVDGSEQCFDTGISFGLTLFSSYQKSHNLAILDKACKAGCFDALNERIKMNCDNIKNDTVPEDVKLRANTTLMHDLERLSLLYWSVGSIQASRVLLDLGNYYRDKQADNDEENPYAAEMEASWKNSASYYFRAKALLKYATSQELVKLYYQEAGLQGSGFHTFNEADDIVLGHFDLVLREGLRKEEDALVEEMISHNNHLK